MERLLSGRVAIVTGAGKGIGAATARTLASAGATVVVAARTATDVEAVCADILRAGNRALAVRTDVADRSQVDQLVGRTLDTFSRIDALVNSAAVVQPAGRPTWECDPGEWWNAFEINMGGVFLATSAVIPQMLQQRAGCIVSLSSPAAHVAVRDMSANCTAKAAINHFTRALALELAGSGVTVNTFNPGRVDTETLATLRGARPSRASLLPVRDTEEAALDLLWLLCGPATSGVTGQFFSWNDPMVRSGVARLMKSQRVLASDLLTR